MVRLSKLKKYVRNLRRNAGTGKIEVRSLEPGSENPVQEIIMPVNGFVLKPEDIYIVEVDRPQSPAFKEENFVDELSLLGISCKVVKKECVLTVARPVRITPNAVLFHEAEERGENE